MQRKYYYNKKLDHALAIFNASAKHTILNGTDYHYLIPDSIYIQMTKEEGYLDYKAVCFCYKDSSTVGKFVSHLRAIPVLKKFGTDKLEIIVKSTPASSKNNPQSVTCEYVVPLHSDLIHQWLGAHASGSFYYGRRILEEFQQKSTYIDPEVSEKKMLSIIKYFNTVSRPLFNYLMLLRRDNGELDILDMFMTGHYEEAFLAHLQKLNDAVINKMALYCEPNGWSPTMDVATRMPVTVWRSYLSRLSSETLSQVVTHTSYNGHEHANIIDIIFSQVTTAGYLRMEIFNILVEHLNSAQCISLALKSANNITPLESLHHYKNITTKLISKMQHNAHEPKQPDGSINQLTSIDFFDAGTSVDTWSGITRSIVGSVPSPTPRPPAADLNVILNTVDIQKPALKADFLNSIKQYGVSFLRLQGRTILLKDKEGMILAVKIKKMDEQPTELSKELRCSTRILNISIRR